MNDPQHVASTGEAPRWGLWAVLFCVWTVPGLVTSSQVYFLHQRYEPLGFGEALLWQLPGWYFWVPVTPGILFLLRVFPMARSHWQRSLPAHLIASLVLSIAHLGVSIAAGRYLIGYAYYMENSMSSLMLELFIRNVHLDIVVYFGVVAAGFAIDYYAKFRERELATSRLSERLAQAELHALKGQLRPHFLFNTLNAVAVLVRKQDTDRAVRTLSQLGGLLRTSLDNAGVQRVRLSQELEFLKGYLEIQQTRFQDRLGVRIRIDVDCLEAEVPSFMLQPLVENSVRHGIAPRAEPGRIEIVASAKNDRLLIEIRDDGVGLAEDWSLAGCTGIGLGSVTARLEQLYGADHTFSISSPSEGGVVVVIEIPLVVPIPQRRLPAQERYVRTR